MSAQVTNSRPSAETTNTVTKLPQVIVTAQKFSEPSQSVPASVTAVNRATIVQENVHIVKDAAVYAPNTLINEFTVRRLSNPFFRGIGGSPNNPGVTICFDGVPQLSGNSSSIELVDVNQIEFVRGPQGALFGRNTEGGLINITSRRSSLTDWRAEFASEYGNYNFFDERVAVSGPIVKDQLGLSIAGGYTAREGFTENTVTGHDLDSRDDLFAKGQLLIQPSDRFEARILFTAEHDNDGDYALGDLASIRAHPFKVSRNDEGFTHRDILAPTLLANYHGEAVEISSITGAVLWKTHDRTDLDYTAMPLMLRDDVEKALQVTQEFRLASPKDSPIELTRNMKLKWQAGVFAFLQNYEQDAGTDFSAGALYYSPPSLISPANTLRSHADLDDVGVGVYGQATFTAWDKLDLTLGLRGDFEDKVADLSEFFTTPDPMLGAPVSHNSSEDFWELSPHGAISWHFNADRMTYFSITRGYRAGGFNTISPPGSETYGTEHSLSYELGYRSRWWEGKLQVNLALFYIDWDDLQLNVPVITSPGRYYIANVGSATSKGVEFDLAYRPLAGWDLFGSVGYMDATFGDGSEELGADISGNRLPYAPAFTGNVGTQYSWAICSAITLYARAEVTICGDFVYDSSNAEGQDTYALANFRAGVRGKHWFAEGWVKNAFDSQYVPVAFPFTTSLAPSGYLGESGAPLTFGVRAGLKF